MDTGLFKANFNRQASLLHDTLSVAGCCRFKPLSNHFQTASRTLSQTDPASAAGFSDHQLEDAVRASMSGARSHFAEYGVSFLVPYLKLANTNAADLARAGIDPSAP